MTLLTIVVAVSNLLPKNGSLEHNIDLQQPQPQVQLQLQVYLQNSSKTFPLSLRVHVRALCVMRNNPTGNFTKQLYKHVILKPDKAKLTSCILLLTLSLSNDVQVINISNQVK